MLRRDLEVETRRVGDRLRVLGEARTGPHEAILRATAQTLIDCATACEQAGSGSPRPESGQNLPQVDRHAWADVITVLANDVLRAAAGDEGGDCGGELSQAVAALVQLRRAM